MSAFFDKKMKRVASALGLSFADSSFSPRVNTEEVDALSADELTRSYRRLQKRLAKFTFVEYTISGDGDDLLLEAALCSFFMPIWINSDIEDNRQLPVCFTIRSALPHTQITECGETAGCEAAQRPPRILLTICAWRLSVLLLEDEPKPRVG